MGEFRRTKGVEEDEGKARACRVIPRARSAEEPAGRVEVLEAGERVEAEDEPATQPQDRCAFRFSGTPVRFQ